MREISEGAPGAEPADGGGWGRFRIGMKWQIAAASLITGLLLCGAFAVTARKHGEFIRANAQAHRDREDVLASEQAVSAFWQEREVMGEILAFPDRSLSDELRTRQLRFTGALEAIGVESAAELADVERAKAANEELIAVFNSQPAGRADVRNAAQLHNAERSVLEPVERLRAGNRRENLRGAAGADSAERVAFQSEVATRALVSPPSLWNATRSAESAPAAVRRFWRRLPALRLAPEPNALRDAVEPHVKRHHGRPAGCWKTAINSSFAALARVGQFSGALHPDRL